MTFPVGKDRSMWNSILVWPTLEDYKFQRLFRDASTRSLIFLYIHITLPIISIINKQTSNISNNLHLFIHFQKFNKNSNFQSLKNRNGFREKSIGCKEDSWLLSLSSFHEQKSSLGSTERVSCGVRRRESEEEICGASLILESAFISSSTQQIGRRVWVRSSNGWLNDLLSWRYLHQCDFSASVIIVQHIVRLVRNRFVPCR